MPRGERKNPQALFWRKVKKLESGCWEWEGLTDSKGYGLFGSGSRLGITRLAHRIAYEWRKGPIPDGMQLDHLCRNHACVNPNHLEVVTCKQNINRSTLVGKVWGEHQKALTHCINGHPFDFFNTYYRLDGSGRSCRACNRERMRRYAHKN